MAIKNLKGVSVFKKNCVIYLGLIMLFPTLVVAEVKAKIFLGINGQVNARLIVVPYKGKYLLHFSNFEHAFDKKTYLYNKVFKEKGAKKGDHYVMTGTQITSFNSLGKSTLIRGTIREYSEVHLHGKSPYKMVFAGIADPSAIRDAKAQYALTQGIFESKIAVKKHIQKAVSAFHKSCHKKLSIKVSWDEFKSNQQKTTPGLAHAYINSLAQVCKVDKDYAEAVKQIHIIEFRLSKKSGKDKLTKKANTIIIYINAQVPNVHHTSFQKIKDVL